MKRTWYLKLNVLKLSKKVQFTLKFGSYTYCHKVDKYVCKHYLQMCIRLVFSKHHKYALKKKKKNLLDPAVSKNMFFFNLNGRDVFV